MAIESAHGVSRTLHAKGGGGEGGGVLEPAIQPNI